MKKIFLQLIIMLLVVSGMSQGKEIAYQEEIITPHWMQKHPYAHGPIKVLFITNDIARREPDELAERFDIKATVLHVISGDAYKNVFDLKALEENLKAKPDVLVISALFPWSDLGSKGCNLILKAIKDGLPLVVFSRQNFKVDLDKFFNIATSDSKGKNGILPFDFANATNITDALSSDISLDMLFKKGNGLKIMSIPTPKSKVLYVTPYDVGRLYFNSFIPWRYPADRGDIIPETSYLLAQRIIRNASAGNIKSEILNFNLKFSLQGSSKLIISANNIENAEKIEWQVKSFWGQTLAKGLDIWPEKRLEIPFSHSGKFYLTWQALNKKQQVIGSGITSLNRPSAIGLKDVVMPELLAQNQQLQVKWGISGTAQAGDMVEAQIYDPDNYLLRVAREPAHVGKQLIAAWQAKYVSYKLRLLLLRGNVILDEFRKNFPVKINRKDDTRHWQTIVWADEQGYMGERWRYYRLRQLGINAMATIGAFVLQNKIASNAGLRVVPTNVFVPKTRFNAKRFSEAEAKSKLREFAPQVVPFSPLGCSLADEPPKSVILPWLAKAEEILKPIDPDLRIGFCGLWLDENLPKFLRKAEYLTPYSPLHLYNVNLWLGIERDFYRLFRRPDSILTCPTQFVPWADHEPYSRTAPWLWLFEEMNGVYFFKSAGAFAVVNSDMRTTHETRWWSSEVSELASGIGEQIMQMARQRGNIGILFSEDVAMVKTWMRAFNRCSIPYRLINANHINDDDLKDVKLIIASDAQFISKKLRDTILRCVKSGTIIIAGNGFSLSDGTNEPNKFMKSLFGFARGKEKITQKDYITNIELLKKVRVSSNISLDNGTSTSLSGLSTGETLPKINTKAQGFNFNVDKTNPLFNSPAVRIGSEGRAMYFAFSPNTDSIVDWLPNLLKKAGITQEVKLLTNGSTQNKVYLFPFIQGKVKVIGLVPDYIRIPPTKTLPAKSDKQTNRYFYHGKDKWQTFKSVLSIGKPAHIYNMRSGKYFGKTDKAEILITPGHPQAYSMLPYKVESVSVLANNSVFAGEDFPFTVQLNVSEGQIQRHVLNIALLDDSENKVAACVKNINAKNGRISDRFNIPANIKRGNYLLVVRDSLSGVMAKFKLMIKVPSSTPNFALDKIKLKVIHNNLNWPDGVLEPIKGKQVLAPAKAVVGKIEKKKFHYHGKFNGKTHLMCDFSLGNNLRTYKLRYLVCCDFAKLKGCQKVKGLNGTGLGIFKPKAHIWYYNSYLRIIIDGMVVQDYAVTEIKDTSKNKNAGVQLTWKTPKGIVKLNYVMVPGHEGLFQKLSIIPSVPISKVVMRFTGFPAGFDKKGKSFIKVAQEHREWMLMGDSIRDLAFYESGGGCGGLLIRPDEWQKASFSVPFPELVSKVRKKASKNEWNFHWVQWIFPKRSNAEASEYMQTHSAATTEMINKVFD